MADTPYDHAADEVLWNVKDALANARPYAVIVKREDGEQFFVSFHGALKPTEAMDLLGRVAVLHALLLEEALGDSALEPDEPPAST